MNLKIGSSQSRGTTSDAGPNRSDPPATVAADSASVPHGRAPKRVNSFGKGLGMALANSMSRASEAVGKKPSANVLAASGGALTPSTAMAQPPTPDASHLYNFSLRLSELINQALASTVPQSQPLHSSMTKHAPGKSAIPSIDQIVYEGRHLPNRSKIQQVAQTVVAELQYAREIDAYLLRAVSRAALKALTLFAARIDGLLVPVAKDPTSLIMPTNAKEGVHISPALEYNLGLATLTWIVEDALERCIEGDREHDGMPGFVSESLTPVRKRMENTILHVIQPVLTGVKISLTASLSKGLRHPFVSGGSPATTPNLSLNETVLPPLSPNNPPGSAVTSPKSSVVGGDLGGGNWLKELQGRLEGTRKLIVPRIEARTSQDGEGWFISVAVHVIWKGLFFITSRPIEQSSMAGGQGLTSSKSNSFFGGGNLGPHQHLSEAGKRNPSPGQISAALKSVASVGNSRGRRMDSTNNVTGAVSPGANNPISAGRSTPYGATQAADGSATPTLVKSGLLTSASAVHRVVAGQLSDLQLFQKMTLRFCKGFLSDKALSAAAADLNRADIDEEVEEDAQLQEEDEEDELARQALAEAFEALKSTITVIQIMDSNFEGVKAALDRGIGPSPRGGAAPVDSNNSSKAAVDGVTAVRPLEAAQIRALKAIPPLLLLHIAYCRLPLPVKLSATGTTGCLSTPPALFGISWVEYERSIAGFVGGGTWAQAAAQRWAKEVQSLWPDYQTRRTELLAKRQIGCGSEARESEDNRDDDESDGSDGSVTIEGLPVPIGERQREDTPNDFSTTPTPARLVDVKVSAVILDASEATPRAVPDPSCNGDPRALCFASRPSLSNEGRRETSSTSRSSSIVSSPAHSPSLKPTATGPEDDNDSLRAMEGGLGDLISDSAEGSSMDHVSQIQSRNGGASNASLPTGNKLQQQIEKSRFWKTSSSSSLASSTSSSTSQSNSATHSPPLVSPSIATSKPSATQGAPSTIGSVSGIAAPIPSSRFHLSRALARANLGSRPSSPAGSLRSLGVRSRSSRRAEPTSAAVGGASGPSAFEEMNDAEVSEVERCLDALRFFARVLEWAGWGSGLDVRVNLS